MARSVKEWIGKSDDTPVPPRVRLRVLEKFGKCCDPDGGCGRAINAGDRWVCDHKQALINNGENRERNLRPLCSWCCPEKDKADVAEKSRSYERRASHAGINRTKHPIRGWRRFDGSVVWNPKARRRT